MDLEAQPYHDDPEFDEIIDKLSNDLFQISSTNGKISELLRKDRRNQPHLDSEGPAETSVATMDLVQLNQQRFRGLKSEIEELQQWQDPAPPHKYSQYKIAADFSRLFVEFQNIQKQVLQHAKEVKHTGRYDVDLSKTADGSKPAPVKPFRDVQGNDDDVSENGDFGEENEPLLEQTLAFEDQLAQHEISYQQGLIADREEEIENVAQGMNELNEIFSNLGTIVREQGMTLDNIEANLYNMSTNVRNGAAQLTKAHSWQRHTSARMCAFLVILLIIALFVALVVLV